MVNKKLQNQLLYYKDSQMISAAVFLPLILAIPETAPSLSKNRVVVYFAPLVKPHYAPMSVTIKTTKGKTYSLYISMDDETNWSTGLRNLVVREMIRANWLVDSVKNLETIIHGVRDNVNQCDRVKSLVITASQFNGKDILSMKSFGKATSRLVEGQAKPAKKSDTTGPDFKGDPYVEFEFIVSDARGSLEINVETTLKGLKCRVEKSGSNNREEKNKITCLVFTDDMLQMCFKASANGTKLRVYGASFNGRYYPATRGTVSSPNIPKKDLPRLSNPPRG